MTADEQLGIFLYGVEHGVANRILAETFQHSGETISRHFNNVLRGIVRLKDDYIMLPSSNAAVHPRIRDNPNFHPFKNAIGAIDGTHIPVVVKRRWEGSTADMRVLRWACERGGFVVPEVTMPITRSQSAGADNAANLEEVETSAISGSGKVRELRGQLAALTDMVAQQTEAAHRQEARMKRLEDLLLQQAAASRETQAPTPPAPVVDVAPRAPSPAPSSSRAAPAAAPQEEAIAAPPLPDHCLGRYDLLNPNRARAGSSCSSAAAAGGRREHRLCLTNRTRLPPAPCRWSSPPVGLEPSSPPPRASRASLPALAAACRRLPMRALTSLHRAYSPAAGAPAAGAPAAGALAAAAGALAARPPPAVP
uniref:DUF8040 domain-containing protein n=1 Tax=Ananas comosus var. bracteatus TaxID=296719 RepID=A0A6V7Q2P6_ANACO|nr:unnamed protein product [Ananas comosus var. bracteatus]